MKSRLLVISVLICSVFLFISCGEKPISQEVSIILDQTEENFSHVTIKEYQSVSTITTDVHNGELVRILPITELSLNRIAKFELPIIPNEFLSNDYIRHFDVDDYFAGIDSVLSEIKKDRRERVGSVIYKVLSEEMNKLSESVADRKLLIINSDLMEHSFIDFYLPSVFNKIKDKPELIEKQMTAKYPLKSLNGIQVIIIYRPISQADGEQFEVVAGFYKAFLESYGANVRITGNL
jgi:hypothetical protein